MNDDPMEALAERLDAGDPAAADAVVRAYEPYLRMVVRRRLTPRLRTRFDSHDVVQSVWVDLLPRLARCGAGGGGPGWEFRDGARLRAFLVRLTQNRFIDFYRRHRASLAREKAFGPGVARSVPGRPSASPSELAQADELWAGLLDACPPAHRELLRLKARGAPLAEIAARTGLHESSVRRILYDLADRLARALPAPG